MTQSPQQLEDAEDMQIERGDVDPEGDFLYPKGVLNVLGMLYRSKKFQRPRGKKSPEFSFEELDALATLLFFKPHFITLKIYKRVPRQRDELPFRRRAFVNHLFGEAKFDAAKAARLAGYSPKSAKQIAHKLLRS